MDPWHTFAIPVIFPGCAGVVVVMLVAFVFSGPDPQPLFAYTRMVPAADPGIATILFVADDPVQPAGKIQV